ncbi:hypothetical protein UFOVP506_21 [uncultured Caudovirales phage]|uniref:Uncharacterized protein n=1 Tax=uncultured Caudovirales phage TaxID=2100421 RepID=A0A6J5ML77_9CAUD|nr:hypothetical protein UFOVP506_21 [uncultured Caudovirales phage]
MFEDYYNNPELQGLLAAAAGGPIMDTPRQTAVMPMTQQAVTPDYLSMLAGLDLSGLGGFGGGRMGGVIQDPNIEYITAPISNKGNPTGKMGGNVFAVTPDQPVRLVDLNTKTVVFEGTGAEAARKATEIGQNLTDTLGRKASYDIQTADPSGSYVTVANEKKNKSTLGSIADVAGTLLPLAAIPLTAGASAGSLLASTAGKIGLGAALGGAGSALKGDDILKGAALGGLSAGIVSGTGLDKALGGVLGDIGGTLAGKTAEEAAKRATGDIVVTGLSKALQGAGGALGQAALSQAGNAASRALSGYQTPAEKFAQQPLPEAFQLPADMYAGLDPINVIGNRAVPSYGGALSGVFEPIATEFLPKSVLPEPLPSEPAPIDDTIVVTGRLPTITPPLIPGFGTAIPAVIPGALNAAQTSSTPPPAKDGVLGTGLSLTQLLAIGGIGSDLLGSLIGGGGGTGTGVPYVSPFGTGAGFAPGRDMRANPNITDYERYGFGPEAMFFRPEYSGLLPANAPAQAPQAMTINPAYMPLI